MTNLLTQQSIHPNRMIRSLLLCLLFYISCTIYCNAFSINVKSSPSSSYHQLQSSSSSFKLFASTLEKPVTIESSTSSSSSSSTSTSNDSDDIPLAPLTQWGQPYDDIVAIQKEAKERIIPEFSYEIFAEQVLSKELNNNNLSKDERNQIELQYLLSNRNDIIEKMQNHGCVIFRNFTLMLTPTGFTSFYNALQMKVCCDPLHTVSARPTIAVGTTNTNQNNKKSPIYEAVNKESRKNFFIGMHQEFVGTRAPAGAAFVCFQNANTGGEFLIADARRIFINLPSNLLSLLYSQQIRYSVIELPFFTWIDTSPIILPMFREPIANMIRNIVSFAMKQKVDFDIDLQWITNQESVYTNNKENNNEKQQQRILQARAPKQPPIIPHPITNDPVWFCNVHSHSAILRQQREAIYGAERFEDGASQINKSDMYYGNDEPLTIEQLQELDRITNEQIKYVKMFPGDVVLLDNYKTLHGRNVFDGVRKHGVAWFEGWEPTN